MSFFMQWQDWADVIPAEELQLLDKGRQQEIEQPLIDLGYLSGNSDLRINVHSFQQQSFKAIQKFRSEYFAADLHLIEGSKSLLLPTYELDSLELNLLHQLTGLDGEIDVPKLPKFGQQNLWTRVIHYRLMVLGLFQEKVESSFSKKSLEAIQQLATWLQLSDANTLAIVNQSGDVPQLTEKLLSTDQLRKTVVVFNYNATSVKKELLKEVAEEQEDKEDETKLLRLEDEVLTTLESIDSEFLSKEEAEWEKLQSKNKRKQNRINRIENKMVKILKAEQNLLTKSLSVEVVLQNKINRFQVQAKALTTSLQSDKREVAKQKEKMANQNAKDKKLLTQKRKEKKELEAKLDAPKDIPGILALIAQANQNNNIRIKNIAHLEKNNGKKAIINSMKKDLKKAEKEIGLFQKKILTIKQIEKLKTEIELLKVNSTAFDVAQQKLDFLNAEKRKTEDRLLSTQKEITKNQTELTKAIARREEKIGEKQLKLQDLNKRLKRLLEKVNGLSYRFKAQLKRSLDQKFYDELRLKVFRDRSTDFLVTASQDSFNQFLIRLIQVRQWMCGYYYGRLDSQPEKQTFQSIVEFTEEEDLPQLRLKYILTNLGQSQKGYWLLNAQYYFECMVKLDKSSETESTLELIEIYEESIAKDKKIYTHKNTREAWESYTKELQEGLDGSEHRIRRFYYGVKTLARSIGRVLKRILRFIIKGAKIVLRILKNFIKLIYKEIREGSRNFFEGMQFLFSRRNIQTVGIGGEQILTDYDFDFDATVFMSQGVSQITLDQHIQKCLAKTNNLHFSLTLCGKVLKWVFTLASGSLSWPRLAIKIAFYFKRLIVDFFKERRRRLKKRK